MKSIASHTEKTPTVGYTRGNDLSGSLEGAGGIGGLLARSHGYSNGSWSTHNFYHADGGGNVTYLVNSSQTLAASYKYDAYGNLATSPSGSLARANVYRFSSKEFHAASGLYYYGYRWYAPSLQRWLNRDPLNDRGFKVLRRTYGFVDNQNLYAFTRNATVGKVDPNGLKIWVCTVRTSGFPLYGAGRHAYFWDDRPGISDKDRECGKEGSSGYGGNSSGNIGPGTGETANPWKGTGTKGATECYQVHDSSEKEKAVMDCCRTKATKGTFVPYANDCHNSVDDCLKETGLSSPPHSRGDPIYNHVKDIEIELDSFR
ncbi:MAG: RHS repeat-associated core domain-containing protein [Verrucomicrobiae bacterium]|nr:RHS repeat-associated core domain-containing protein [Verrucomicrobiae bacterium]